MWYVLVGSWLRADCFDYFLFAQLPISAFRYVTTNAAILAFCTKLSSPRIDPACRMARGCKARPTMAETSGVFPKPEGSHDRLSYLVPAAEVVQSSPTMSIRTDAVRRNSPHTSKPKLHGLRGRHARYSSNDFILTMRRLLRRISPRHLAEKVLVGDAAESVLTHISFSAPEDVGLFRFQPADERKTPLAILSLLQSQ